MANQLPKAVVPALAFVVGTMLVVQGGLEHIPGYGWKHGSVMVFQLAPLLECDDIPVTLMSALGAGAKPAHYQHAMEHDWSDLDVCIYA